MYSPTSFLNCLLNLALRSCERLLTGALLFPALTRAHMSRHWLLREGAPQADKDT